MAFNVFVRRAEVKQRARSVVVFACAVLSAPLLGGCLFGIAGSGLSGPQAEAKLLFDQASALQTAATHCANSACKDADLTAAVRKYQQILKLNPLNQYAYYDLGVIYTTSGQTSAASTALQRCLLIDPSYYPAMYNLANLDASTGDTKTAISLFSQAAGLRTATTAERANASFNLGYLLDSAGQRQQGDAAFTNAVALKPSLQKLIPAKFLPPQLSSTSSGVSGAT